MEVEQRREKMIEDDVEEDEDEMSKFTKLIEYLFKYKIAVNKWMQPCPANNKFDKFLNSFPTKLGSRKMIMMNEKNNIN